MTKVQTLMLTQNLARRELNCTMLFLPQTQLLLLLPLLMLPLLPLDAAAAAAP